MNHEERGKQIRNAIMKCKWRKNVGGINVCTGNCSPCQTEIVLGRCDRIKHLDEEIYDERKIEFLRRKSK